MNYDTRQFEIGAIGLKETEIDTAHSESTRFLCASALLEGYPFRRMVLQRSKELCRGFAPEIGIDLELVMRVCKFMEARELGYYLIFFGLSLLALLIVFITRSTSILLLFLIAATAIQLYKTLDDRYRLLPFFTKEKFDPELIKNKFSADLTADEQASIPPADQNLIVYRDFTPFIGAGIDLNGWSFALDLDCAKEHMGSKLPIVTFELTELYSAIEQAIRSANFRGLQIKDFLYVSGADIRDDRTILPQLLSCPITRVPADIMARYSAASDTRVRHYQWIRILSWSNELVVSYFLRFAIQGQNLFIELNRYLLTPLNFQYREVDAIRSLTWRNMLGLIIASPFSALFSIAYAWVALLNKLSDGLSQATGGATRKRKRLVQENPLYNYGADTSLRGQVASQKYMRYFQKLDFELYIKVVEREILDTIIDFLDSHNIDVSQIRERQTTILNSGVFVQGGNVNAQTMAVGSSAQATTNQISDSIRRFTSADK